MEILEQNCEVCEYRTIKNTDGFCYMFKDKVKCCAQFIPIKSQKDKKTKSLALKLFPVFSRFLN